MAAFFCSFRFFPSSACRRFLTLTSACVTWSALPSISNMPLFTSRYAPVAFIIPLIREPWLPMIHPPALPMIISLVTSSAENAASQESNFARCFFVPCIDDCCQFDYAFAALTENNERLLPTKYPSAGLLVRLPQSVPILWR